MNHHAPPGGAPVHGPAAAAGLLLLLVLWCSTTPALSAWTSARVVNPGSDARSATLAFSHTAGPCTLGPGVSGTIACAGAPTGTDVITDNGTIPAASLTSTVSAASCGPVQLTNTRTAADVLLARKNVAFRATDPWSGTSAVTLDGASYASAVVQQSEGTLGTYGLGVWFKAASGSSGPMFSFGTNPTATAGADDRALVLNADGTVSFRLTGSLVNLTSTSGTSYADGAWHFAYVRLSLVSVALSSFSLTVDGAAPVTSTQVVGLSGTTGYWRLGWAPTTLTGAPNAFFTGSLSNLVVFYGATVPSAAPTAAERGSQSSFSTWASGATEQWPLGDSGTTTYAGSQPVLLATSPCTAVDIAWTFTGPAGTAAAAGTRLSAFGNGVPHPIAAPGPGASQVSTLTTSLDAGNSAATNAYVSGLRLYIPFVYVVSTSSGAWPLTFSWSSSGSVVIA